MMALRHRPGRERQRRPCRRASSHGLPHVILVVIVAVSSYYQQKQIQGRNPNAEMPPQQKMLMRLMPLPCSCSFAFVAPSALVVYFVMSNLYRIGMQYYITRTLYHGEDSLGAQAQRAAAEAKKLKEAEGGGIRPPAPASGSRKDAAPTPRRPPRTDRRRPTEGSRRPGRRRHQRLGPATAPSAAPPTARSGPHGRATGPRRRRRQVAAVEWVETTGKTVEEAKDAALDQLGVDEQDAEFEVVEEPRTGLFGRTRGEARVRARVRPTQPRPKVERRDRRGRAAATDQAGRAPSGATAPGAAATSGPRPAEGAGRGRRAGRRARPPRRPPAPTAAAGDRRPPAAAAAPQAPRAAAAAAATGRRPHRRHDDEQESIDMTETELAEQGEVVRGFLVDLLDAFGLDGDVTATPAEEGAVELEVAGDDLGLLIGPKGATLQAVQELSRSVLQRTLPGESHARIRVDVGGYRARRREALERASCRTVAEDVRDSRRPEGARADVAAGPQGRPRHGQRDRRRAHDVRGRGRPPPGRHHPRADAESSCSGLLRRAALRGRPSPFRGPVARPLPRASARAGPRPGVPRPGPGRRPTSSTPAAFVGALDGGRRARWSTSGSGGGVPGLVLASARPDLRRRPRSTPRPSAAGSSRRPCEALGARRAEVVEGRAEVLGRGVAAGDRRCRAWPGASVRRPPPPSAPLRCCGSAAGSS